ncbi:MAG TPA: HAD family hydrolase [Candidatus Tectomicrobia bacterium]|jgi:phosphonatase-like hydrolase
MSITLAMLDMAATTVDDTIDGRPLVLQSFAESFATARVAVPWAALNAQRGKDKLEVFRLLLARHGGLCGAVLEQTAQALLQDFTARLLRNVERLHEMPGATTAFACLKHHGVFVALGSGFPLEVTQAIAQHLGWTATGLVDYVTCGEAAGAGRPRPHMINRALQAAGLLLPHCPVDCALPGFDYHQVLKVGDTVQDVAEGLHVGALTVAVASGTQTTDVLAQAGPAAVLPSVAALPEYLLRICSRSTLRYDAKLSGSRHR